MLSPRYKFNKQKLSFVSSHFSFSFLFSACGLGAVRRQTFVIVIVVVVTFSTFQLAKKRYDSLILLLQALAGRVGKVIKRCQGSQQSQLVRRLLNVMQPITFFCLLLGAFNLIYCCSFSLFYTRHHLIEAIIDYRHTLDDVQQGFI